MSSLIFISTMDLLEFFNIKSYLFCSTGNFSLALDKLKEKTLQILFSLTKHTIFSKLPPFLANKIFNAMISTILPYNSRVWCAYAKSDLKSWDSSFIEKAHRQFCKRYLLVISNKASNVACRVELGRFPLITAINQKIMNCTSYLLSKGIVLLFPSRVARSS